MNKAEQIELEMMLAAMSSAITYGDKPESYRVLNIMNRWARADNEQARKAVYREVHDLTVSTEK